jgi:hypothetical protein
MVETDREAGNREEIVTDEQPAPGEPVPRVSRRRALTAAGGVAAVGGLAALSAAGILAPRPVELSQLTVDAATAQRLVDLSRTLCGGGTFDTAQATLLLEALAADAELGRGLVDLLLAPPVPGVSEDLSTEAEAARRAILRFWYAGEINGEPVADRGAAYDQLTAWQAMYTPPFAVCKAYGAWAEAPDDAPAVPSV